MTEQRSTLPPMDVAGRLPRLRALFEEHGCDALLVTNLTNVRYLTGFTGSAGMLLVTADGALLVTDGRYATQSAEQLASAGVAAEIEFGDVQRQQEVTARAGAGLGRIGLESTSVTWSKQQSFAGEWFPSEEVVPTEGMVERLRRVKDAGELARIEEAARLADAALAVVAPGLRDGPTEREFGLELDHTMRTMGADDVSFETIVASGPNAAKPHARPSARPVGRGELVVIDFGALVDGYHSDMTRTVCVGEPSSGDAKAAVTLVAEAQAAGVGAVRAGVAAVDVDAACRDLITAAGLGSEFVHGTGHGVGLDIHEFPILNATTAATLESGFVVTVEPGVYLPGRFGVRIEDSVVVDDHGCRRLTNAPKELVID